MPEKRIICVGTGNDLTRPDSIHAENGRYYRYPNPGSVHLWGGDATELIEDNVPNHEFVSAYTGGPLIQGYGMIYLGDTYEKILKNPPESDQWVGLRKREFEIKIETSLVRAWAITSAWTHYGTLIITGEFPTADELNLAREKRRTHAMNRLNQEINMQQAARSGRGSAKLFYSDSDRAWAMEYGVALPETVDTMKKVDQVLETIQCPECRMMISAEAKRCRHCGMSFKMPVTEFIEKMELTLRAG